MLKILWNFFKSRSEIFLQRKQNTSLNTNIYISILFFLLQLNYIYILNIIYLYIYNKYKIKTFNIFYVKHRMIKVYLFIKFEILFSVILKNFTIDISLFFWIFNEYFRKSIKYTICNIMIKFFYHLINASIILILI